MSVRLIPITDDAEFPYDSAAAMLRSMDNMLIEDVDFPSMIEAGKRFGWPQALIDSHWAMMERGNCFHFHQDCPPELHGDMYEDNIWLTFFDAEHEEACMPVIDEMAKTLGVRKMIV